MKCLKAYKTELAPPPLHPYLKGLKVVDCQSHNTVYTVKEFKETN